jgi:hypothetical protein
VTQPEPVIHHVDFGITATIKRTASVENEIYRQNPVVVRRRFIGRIVRSAPRVERSVADRREQRDLETFQRR